MEREGLEEIRRKKDIKKAGSIETEKGIQRAIERGRNRDRQSEKDREKKAERWKWRKRNTVQFFGGKSQKICQAKLREK